MNLLERITFDPEQCGRRPCIRGMRILVKDVLGDSVMMPTRIKIDAPSPAPESDDASFYKAWNEPPKDVAFAKVFKAWKNQEVVP
jgi:hypothetical protein